MLIFSTNPTKPSLIEKATQKTLRKVFPKKDIEIVGEFNDTSDYDHSFTIVIPGNSLILLNESLDPYKSNIRKALNAGANYLGFCAGAYLGTYSYIAGKRIINNEYSIYNEYSFMTKGNLSAIPDCISIGPIKPYSSAIPMGGFKYSAQAALIKTYDNIEFNSIYLEGCTFIDKNKKLPYQFSKANYKLDYSLTMKTKYNPEYDSTSDIVASCSTIDFNHEAPAFLHHEVNGSHRLLFSFHPELAVNSRKIIQKLEDSQTVTFSNKDKLLLCTELTEEQNLDFLKKTLKPLNL